MEFYTIEYFHNFFDNKQKVQSDKRVKFIFCAYLIEVVAIPTKALTEIITMKKFAKDFSLKD